MDSKFLKPTAHRNFSNKHYEMLSLIAVVSVEPNLHLPPSARVLYVWYNQCDNTRRVYQIIAKAAVQYAVMWAWHSMSQSLSRVDVPMKASEAADMGGRNVGLRDQDEMFSVGGNHPGIGQVDITSIIIVKRYPQPVLVLFNRLNR